MSKQAAQSPPPNPKLAVIGYPAANQVVLVQNYDPTAQTGSVLVRYVKDDPLATQVIACFQPAAGSFSMPNPLPPGPLPAGCFSLTEVGTTATFQNTNGPVNNLPPQPLAGNNLRVFVGAYDAGGNLRDQRNTAFVAMPAVVRYSVLATHCLWLVYADPTTPPLQPFGETVAPPSPYLPIPVLVPDGATQVRVDPATTPAASWRHDPNPTQASDPQGLAGTEQPLDPRYQTVYRNAALHSANITSGAFRLNRLVGLWVYGDPTVATSELDVIQTNQFAIPTGAASPVSLCLGFHDGYQWSNNFGNAPVQVTWAP